VFDTKLAIEMMKVEASYLESAGTLHDEASHGKMEEGVQRSASSCGVAPKSENVYVDPSRLSLFWGLKPCIVRRGHMKPYLVMNHI